MSLFRQRLKEHPDPVGSETFRKIRSRILNKSFRFGQPLSGMNLKQNFCDKIHNFSTKSFRIPNPDFCSTRVRGPVLMTSGRERGRDGMADKPHTGVSAIRLHGGLDTILQVTSTSRVPTLVFLLIFFTYLPNPITRRRYRTVQTYQVDDGEPLPIDGPVTAAQPPPGSMVPLTNGSGSRRRPRKT